MVESTIGRNTYDSFDQNRMIYTIRNKCEEQQKNYEREQKLREELQGRIKEMEEELARFREK